MNDVPAGIITIGTRLRSDGGLWEVAELAATGVVLRDALGGLRQASISGLLADPATRLLDVPAGQAALSQPGTSGMTVIETEELRRLAGHVQEVLRGARQRPPDLIWGTAQVGGKTLLWVKNRLAHVIACESGDRIPAGPEGEQGELHVPVTAIGAKEQRSLVARRAQGLSDTSAPKIWLELADPFSGSPYSPASCDHTSSVPPAIDLSAWAGSLD